ncbi:MAG: response regulator [Planctomycetota bacterium]|jgi:two-component system chemotaxis response regulator CheY|nr:response regulator [Planctomycetota bacterium]
MKILVVDDSSTMRRIISNILKSNGYTDIVEAGDGVEGLNQLKAHPDVKMVLTDWNMPNMNGLEFLTKIRETTPNTELPVVMVTTEAEKANVVAAIKAGANNYIVKPFTPEIVKTKLEPFFGKA